MEKKFTFNNWVGQMFSGHIKLSNDGKTITRISFSGKGFSFSGKNPLSLPKKVKSEIEKWMEETCKENNMGVWDCEAWEGYENTKVVL